MHDRAAHTVPHTCTAWLAWSSCRRTSHLLLHEFKPTTHITTVTPHRYNTETVSGEVLGCMKQRMMAEPNPYASPSFLLEDDSTLPFGKAAQVLVATDDSGLYAGIPVPDALKSARHSGAGGDGGAGGAPMAGGMVCVLGERAAVQHAVGGRAVGAQGGRWRSRISQQSTWQDGPGSM